MANRGGKKKWIKGCKERGEWAELCFMAKAAGLGMGVSKPLGDSLRYDVLVEAGGRILRVQVKSTIYRRRGSEYSLNVMGPQRKKYKAGTVDFFAVYLIPVDEWYIIPYEAVWEKLTLHFSPSGGRQKYGKYREAWDLLRGGNVSIQACADLVEWEEIPEFVEGENFVGTAAPGCPSGPEVSGRSAVAAPAPDPRKKKPPATVKAAPQERKNAAQSLP